jgi:hypothetical protein
MKTIAASLRQRISEIREKGNLTSDEKAELRALECEAALTKKMKDVPADARWNEQDKAVQRLWRMRPLAVLKEPLAQDIVQTERKTWSAIRKRLRAAAKSERTLLGTLEVQCAKMLGKVKRFHKEMEETSDPLEVKVIEDKMNAWMRTVSDHVLPLLEKLKQGPTAEQAFDNAYTVDSLEKIVRLEAAVDVRISKVLARLVALKEYKRAPAAGRTVIPLSASPQP